MMLALLMAGTSGAVASWVSPWLVPPYLVLMALLLIPSTSTGRRQADPASEGSGASDSPRPARPAGDLDDPDSPSEAPDSPELSGDGPEPGDAAKPPKARRGKGRVRKAKPLPEPAEATWVQVAPGKFVRVEAADGSTGQAGPHASWGIPVEAPTTPHRLESDGIDDLDRLEGRDDDEAPPGAEFEARPEDPFEDAEPFEGPIDDAGPAFDPVEGPEGDPTGAIESGPATELGWGQTAGSAGTFEGPSSAADGIAPQAEESPESPEPIPPEAPLQAEAGGRLLLETGEGWGEEDDPSSAFEDPEPTGPEALADVPSEEADERGETLEGADPTETPVDETDLDDAGPLEPAPREWPPPEDADPSETEPLPAASRGPSRRPRGLAPRAKTRVGHPLPRATGRTSPPPGRPVRSREAARPSRDPRRLGRRGVARPRQVNRTFPPRSPPADHVGRDGTSRPCVAGGQSRDKG